MQALALDESIQIVDSIPLILALNKGGEATGWLTYEKSAFYFAKNKVLWSMGEHAVRLRGGTNAKTGLPSVLTVPTIIAIDNGESPHKYRKRDPSLTNTTLFRRDQFLCAYCGDICKKGKKDPTRDHVTPTSKGGKDVWENVVTACYGCNQAKGNLTLEQADMKLLYVPYAPTWNEHLILENRRILADQMEFLMHGVSPHSRLHG